MGPGFALVQRLPWWQECCPVRDGECAEMPMKLHTCNVTVAVPKARARGVGGEREHFRELDPQCIRMQTEHQQGPPGPGEGFRGLLLLPRVCQSSPAGPGCRWQLRGGPGGWGRAG